LYTNKSNQTFCWETYFLFFQPNKRKWKENIFRSNQ